jgi:hypothetical protein
MGSSGRYLPMAPLADLELSLQADARPPPDVPPVLEARYHRAAFLATGCEVMFMCPCIFHLRSSTQNKQGGGENDVAAHG